MNLRSKIVRLRNKKQKSTRNTALNCKKRFVRDPKIAGAEPYVILDQLPAFVKDMRSFRSYSRSYLKDPLDIMNTKLFNKTQLVGSMKKSTVDCKNLKVTSSRRTLSIPAQTLKYWKKRNRRQLTNLFNNKKQLADHTLPKKEISNVSIQTNFSFNSNLFLNTDKYASKKRQKSIYHDSISGTSANGLKMLNHKAIYQTIGSEIPITDSITSQNWDSEGSTTKLDSSCASDNNVDPFDYCEIVLIEDDNLKISTGNSEYDNSSCQNLISKETTFVDTSDNNSGDNINHGIKYSKNSRNNTTQMEAIHSSNTNKRILRPILVSSRSFVNVESAEKYSKQDYINTMYDYNFKSHFLHSYAKKLPNEKNSDGDFNILNASEAHHFKNVKSKMPVDYINSMHDYNSKNNFLHTYAKKFPNEKNSGGNINIFNASDAHHFKNGKSKMPVIETSMNSSNICLKKSISISKFYKKTKNLWTSVKKLKKPHNSQKTQPKIFECEQQTQQMKKQLKSKCNKSQIVSIELKKLSVILHRLPDEIYFKYLKKKPIMISNILPVICNVKSVNRNFAEIDVSRKHSDGQKHADIFMEHNYSNPLFLQKNHASRKKIIWKQEYGRFI